MPRKPITWIGSIIILAAGVFCCWAVIQYRNDYAAVGAQHHLLTVAAFGALPVAALAIFLLYYFIERR
jgi:hypothetical protein